MLQKIYETMTQQLWLEHSDRICNYFKKRTGNEPLACDLMQDTFKKVIDHRDKLEDIDNHKAWLYRIAQNKFIDYTQKKKEVPLSDSTLPQENDKKGEHSAEIRSVADCLYQLIQEYDEEDQELLIQIFRKSLTQKEGAQYLDLPYSTFKSRIQKARKEIAREFDKRCCQLKYNRDGHIIGCSSI